MAFIEDGLFHESSVRFIFLYPSVRFLLYLRFRGDWIGERGVVCTTVAP